MEPQKSCKPGEREKTILVIESEESIRTLLAEELSEEGDLVITTADGSDALAIIEKNHPQIDLVITDLKHQGLDAMKLLAKIKKHWPELPVIFYTAYGAFLDTFLAWGPDAVVIKDADLDYLKKTVKKLLNL
jgi:two-component system cell cycle sensor histidine kinase/response regulator CckA